MSSLNQVQIIGRLGKDPEVKYAPSGDAIATLSVATSEKWKDKQSGEMKEATEWHRVVLWGKLAEVAGQYLKKGALVFFQGQLKTRKWQDKDGQDRYTTEINAREMKMLGGKPDDSGGGREQNNGGSRPQGQQQRPAGNQQQRKSYDDSDDPIPF